VSALENAWEAIRGNHPEVPRVVIVVASGGPVKASYMTYGHYATMRWQYDTDNLPEVLVSGEGLKRGAPEVLATLLHEAAHSLADARGSQDTSRQGRWHNRKFAALADELGLDVTKDAKIGWSPSTLRSTTETTYRSVLDDLHAVLSAYRHPDLEGIGGGRNSNNPLACSCARPRRIRVARAVYDLGAITCAVCGSDFEAEDNDA
jgi:hypothetical protein